jgi:hypothetical protein
MVLVLFKGRSGQMARSWGIGRGSAGRVLPKPNTPGSFQIMCSKVCSEPTQNIMLAKGRTLKNTQQQQSSFKNKDKI